MNATQFSNSQAGIPDFQSVAQSIKAIKRSAPAASGGVYTYFADKFKLASTVADELDKQITNALTSLPGKLGRIKAVPSILDQIGEVDEALRLQEISTEDAAAARADLKGQMSTAVSSTITDFKEAATKLSEPADRLTNYAREIEVRQKDAVATEISNHARAQQDVERESARLNMLEARYEKLKSAVDEARGGSTEEIVGLIPDPKELSSLVDVGAADAAAPEVAAAKKAIEQGVEQIKKILKLVDKTIKFAQLTELRDEVYKTFEAQHKVTETAKERLRRESATLADLETFKTTGALMTSLAAEANKLVTAFSSFAATLQNLDGQKVTADTLKGIVSQMESYLEQARNARNSFIL